jgi:S-layer homology domain
MHRLTALFAAAVLALTFVPAPLSATPLADVPSSHWAYAAIAALAADGLIDGYPDGSFNGDRPLTRYEMAAIVARVIARIEATGAKTASKADLDNLQKLIDALKDELDALGVRVTSLEDLVSSLDRRTRVAQALAIHGTLLGNASFRTDPVTPQTVAGGGIDPFVNAYETSPDDNDPFAQQIGPQTILRSDSRFNFIYTVDENVTVSLPVHVLDYDWSSAGAQQLTISPDVVIDVAHAGAFTNLTFRAAELDNIASSRLGLAYLAPTAAQQADYQTSAQPFPRGYEIGGIIAGLTTFQFTFAQVDQTLINTQSFYTGSGSSNTYYAPVVPPQSGLVQTGSTPTTDTFAAGANVLPSVYLSKKAVAGTVVISAYSSAGGPAGLPAFSYLDGTNEVVFAAPLPPGSRVSISYTGLGYTNNQVAQRYQTGLRINQQFAGLPGAEVGLTYHRLWDEDLPQGSAAAAVDLGPNGMIAGDFGEVSDAVFGLDFQVPLAARGAHPLLFGEVAGSQYTPDQQLVAVTGANAAVAGLKFTFGRTQLTLQYQTVGANYMDGAPLRFFGNAPATWVNYSDDFEPGFFGFANTLGINQTFDASIGGHSATAANPALTFLYPVFNPFVAGGPTYYSAFAPNTQGPSLTLNGPLRLAGLMIDGRLFAQHLTQLQADSGGTATFGPAFATNVRATFDKLDAGATFPVHVGGTKISINLAGTLEHLRRDDMTGYAYVPYNPATASYDTGALANFEAAGGTVNPATGKILSTGSSAVLYYPNYVSMTHTQLAAGAALPLTPDIVFNTRYSDQRYFGAYGTTLQQNIGGIKDQVDLGLTYTVPKTTSSVGLTFRNSSYKDATLSSYNFDQNRGDVNFTIRF